MLSTGLWWSLNNHRSRGYVLLAQKSKGLSSLLIQLVFQRITTDCRHCWLLHWPLHNKVSGRKAVMCLLLHQCWWWHWHLLFMKPREQGWCHLDLHPCQGSCSEEGLDKDWLVVVQSLWLIPLLGWQSISQWGLAGFLSLPVVKSPATTVTDYISHIFSSLDDPI